MMQPETLQSPSWSSLYETAMNSTFDQFVESYGFFNMDDDDHFGDCGFSAIFNNTPSEYTSSSDEVYFTTPFPSSSNDHHIHMHNSNIPYTIGEDTLHLHLPSLMEDFPMELDQDFSPTTTTMMMSSQGSFPSQNFSSEVVQEYASSPTPSMKSELSSIQQPSLNFPQENREIQKQLILPHLLEACGEALEKGHIPLAEEILRCMSQKVTPLGESSERFAFYFSSQDMTKFWEYLKAEALKNFEAAFRAFYQGTPHGKFAHFAAISAILGSIPQDCDAVHIVDSYMGLGIQWIPMIEAISHMNRTLKLISIKRGNEIPESTSTQWNFDETKRQQLYEHARSCGLKLKAEEKEMEEVVAEIKKINKRDGKKVFFAFNCMVGLPHMGKVRSRREAMEFLRLAKDLIKSSGNKGIITFGDGDTFEKLKSCLNFRSFFEGQLVHYHALLEAVESHFPTSFSEARTAMECLFVAPNVSPFAWLEKWEEMRSDYCCNLQGDEIGLKGCRLSKNILLEVREMLRGSEGSYQARIEGQNGNELVLEWKGAELVRISAWRN